MKIYLASRYSRREELRGYAEQLKAAGHEVTSRWLYTHHRASEDAPEEWERLAVGDVEDVRRSSCLMAFTEAPGSPRSRGGRHVEWGLALGYGLLCVVVGPVENVFYALPKATRFDDWPTARAWLEAQP